MSDLVQPDVYAREVVMARVGHLIRRKQHEIERIVRILRSAFDPSAVLAPEHGTITRIWLIGPYARRSWYEDAQSLEFSDYELWVAVNHPLFTDERCWSRAHARVDRELGRRCAVDVSVFSKADIGAAEAEHDHFMLDRIEAGIMLYNAARDAPLSMPDVAK